MFTIEAKEKEGGVMTHAYGNDSNLHEVQGALSASVLSLYAFCKEQGMTDEDTTDRITTAFLQGINSAAKRAAEEETKYADEETMFPHFGNDGKDKQD